MKLAKKEKLKLSRKASELLKNSEATIEKTKDCMGRAKEHYKRTGELILKSSISELANDIKTMRKG